MHRFRVIEFSHAAHEIFYSFNEILTAVDFHNGTTVISFYLMRVDKLQMFVVQLIDYALNGGRKFIFCGGHRFPFFIFSYKGNNLIQIFNFTFGNYQYYIFIILEIVIQFSISGSTIMVEINNFGGHGF